MLRNPNRLNVELWRGLDTYTPQEDIASDVWFDANNVLVNAKGKVEALRSPNTFGNTTGGTGTLLGISEYKRNAGHAMIIDRGAASYYLLAAAGSPASIRTGQAGNAWTSLNLNDRYHRIDGIEFVQILTDFSVRRNGIDAPAAAPVIAYVTNGITANENIEVSYQGSYAYRNSVTGHVSQPSPLSNILTPDTGHNSLSWTVTASAQTGVDQIIFFLTVDGGSIPYLVIDCDDEDITTAANSTATVYLHLADITNDTLTPEPIYNAVPPVTGTSMFDWKDRVVLIVDGGLRYSAFETCYIGNGIESWPELNQLNLPTKSDRAVGGVSTQIGALVFGKDDSYLLSGSLSDKTSGPNNVIAATEHLDPLNWKIGITYPQTAANTPFGPIWVDQTKRVRHWSLTGFPEEIAQPLRTELDEMTGALQARWFQHGKNGGYYVLTNGTTTLFIMLYLGPDGQTRFGYGKSDISLDAIASVTFSSERFFFAKTNQVYEILDPDLAGDGWAAGTEIFFKIMIGNEANFSSLHSMQIEGELSGLVVKVSNTLEDDAEEVILEEDLETGGTQFGMIDSPERRRHVMNFEFDLTDTELRTITGFELFRKNKKRLI